MAKILHDPWLNLARPEEYYLPDLEKQKWAISFLCGPGQFVLPEPSIGEVLLEGGHH